MQELILAKKGEYLFSKEKGKYFIKQRRYQDNSYSLDFDKLLDRIKLKDNQSTSHLSPIQYFDTLEDAKKAFSKLRKKYRKRGSASTLN